MTFCLQENYLPVLGICQFQTEIGAWGSVYKMTDKRSTKTQTSTPDCNTIFQNRFSQPHNPFVLRLWLKQWTVYHVLCIFQVICKIKKKVVYCTFKYLDQTKYQEICMQINVFWSRICVFRLKSSWCHIHSFKGSVFWCVATVYNSFK